MKRKEDNCILKNDQNKETGKQNTASSLHIGSKIEFQNRID